jgi:tetratricopeptide (TPR) repeat protein
MNPQIAYLLNLSLQNIQSGRLDEAERLLKQVIKIQPKNADALCFLSVVSAHKLNYQEALIAIDKAIEASPRFPLAYSNKGNILKELGRYDEAIASLDKAIQLDRNFVEAYNNKGNVLQAIEDYEEAILSYNKAISIDSNFVQAYNNKGNAFERLHQFEEALDCYLKALAINPNYAEAYSNRGLVFFKLKRYSEALSEFDKAIVINPLLSEAWTHKGEVLHELEYFSDAISHFDKALEIKPNFAEAWADKAAAYGAMKSYADSLSSYERAYSIKPTLNYLLGDFVHTQMFICDWTNIEDRLVELQNRIISGDRAASPFKVLSAFDSPKLNLLSAKSWVTDKFPTSKELVVFEKNKHSKIKVGYFSADFINHPVAILTSELFELHDRNRFEVYGFSLARPNPEDQVQIRLRNTFDKFIDIQDIPTQEVVRMAREMELDIAIDLGGHTLNAPTQIMASRVAPLQINYLGYPGTMGADYIDYIIADKILIPADSREFYSEKVIYLPDSYMVDDSSRLPSSRIFTRQECGLPEEGFVFCCFNNSYKFNKKMLKSWVKILNATPKSVVWISENTEIFRKNLIAEFEKMGINGSRIIFAKRMDPMADHLARYKLADLFLDTNPYNAHTTAVDALKAGIPVLTLLGNVFAGRVAASLLSAIGLQELIVDSLREYEALAIDLANNPQKIKYFKNRLKENQNKEPLFNTKLYVKNIESAFIEIHRRHIEGDSLEHIYV